MNELLEIVGLDVSFPSQHGTTYAVRDVSINLKPGEVLGIIESRVSQIRTKIILKLRAKLRLMTRETMD